LLEGNVEDLQAVINGARGTIGSDGIAEGGNVRFGHVRHVEIGPIRQEFVKIASRAFVGESSRLAGTMQLEE